MTIDASIDFTIATVIFISAIFQGIFGVGVLLLGTPILLLLQIDYISVLSILLPTSLSISLTQTVSNLSVFRLIYLYKFLYLCLIPLLIGLYFVIFQTLDVKIFVFIALMLAGVIRRTRQEFFHRWLASRKDFLLPLIGFVHGVSNLGGSILVVWATLSEHEKLKTQTLIAFIYFFLALSQIVSLSISNQQIHVYVSYLVIGFISHFIGTTLSHHINEERFQGYLTNLIFFMAALILVSTLELY